MTIRFVFTKQRGQTRKQRMFSLWLASLFALRGMQVDRKRGEAEGALLIGPSGPNRRF